MDNKECKITSPGLGFWLIKKEDAKNVFISGYQAGYRHFDTAIVYGNEKEIGEAIKELNVPRESFFLTSKIDANTKSYKKAKEAIKESLARLGVDYLDLMLIHAPKPWLLMFIPFIPRYKKANREVWRAMLDAKKEGKIKNLGVSNFNIKDIKNIQNYSKEKIFTNQIRIHIGHVPYKLIKYCKDNNILLEAYSPIGTGRLKNKKKLKVIANKYNVSVPQLCIKYCEMLDTLPLPRSKNPNHIKENLKLDFTISKEDMDELAKIKVL